MPMHNVSTCRIPNLCPCCHALIPVQTRATSLIRAVQNGHDAVVRLLLAHKADPSGVEQVVHLPDYSYDLEVMKSND
jgi:hypothetical protein